MAPTTEPFRICAEQLGKKFGSEWIVKDFTYNFETGNTYAVTGYNGSGKSTLLRILLGLFPPSEGKVSYWQGAKHVAAAEVYPHLAFCAPYLELVEEFTLLEQIEFYRRFKPLEADNGPLLALLGMEKAAHKHIRFFSSGMKQKIKLALAMYSHAPALLLDEPTTNFDKANTQWYIQLLEKQRAAGKLIIVCSNQEHEYSGANHIVDVTQHKPKR